MKITQEAVETLQPPASGKSIFYDDKISGFGIRVTASNAKAFVLNYRVNGRKRQHTIGIWPVWNVKDARAEADDLRSKIAKEGFDPQGAKQTERGAPIMEKLAEEYLDSADFDKKKDGSKRNDRRMLKNSILPKLGRLRVKAVTKRDIESLHKSMSRTPYEANRVLDLLSKMFSLAIEWGWRPDNPVHGVKRNKEYERKAFMDEDQLRMLVKALNSYPQNPANALRLLMVTGGRSSEVREAEWSHFNLKTGVWTKPHRLTKEGEDEYVPLNDAALMMLRQMAEHKEHETFLFPGRGGKKATAPRMSLMRAWIQVCRRAGLARSYQVMGKRGKLLTRWRPTFRIHDIRHSFASILVGSGVPIYEVQKLLCHHQLATTERYAHLANQPLRIATNRFPTVLQLEA